MVMFDVNFIAKTLAEPPFLLKNISPFHLIDLLSDNDLNDLLTTITTTYSNHTSDNANFLQTYFNFTLQNNRQGFLTAIHFLLSDKNKKLQLFYKNFFLSKILIPVQYQLDKRCFLFFK